MTAMTLLGWFPLGVLPAALAGALMAFLLWNFYPAKLRPGAVGCQFLAGALGCVPLSVGWPGLTLPLALPYWLEGGMETDLLAEAEFLCRLMEQSGQQALLLGHPPIPPV